MLFAKQSIVNQFSFYTSSEAEQKPKHQHLISAHLKRSKAIVNISNSLHAYLKDGLLEMLVIL